MHTIPIDRRATSVAAALCLLLLATGVLASGQGTSVPAAALFAQARAAASEGDAARAAKLADEAVAASEGAVGALLERGRLLDTLRMFDRAISDYNTVLDRVDASFDLLRIRAGARFKSGDVEGSIVDFERAAQLAPDRNRELWELGIAYYYAGKYEQGAEQFALYQTYYAADVENIVWRFLCQAAASDAAAARADMMPLEGVDRRVPLMEVDALFRGRGAADAVLKAATAGNPSEGELRQRLFYGHLYLGLYYAAMGSETEARHHLQEARAREISHYMWDVVNVHCRRLDEPAKKEDAGESERESRNQSEA